MLLVLLLPSSAPAFLYFSSSKLPLPSYSLQSACLHTYIPTSKSVYRANPFESRQLTRLHPSLNLPTCTPAYPREGFLPTRRRPGHVSMSFAFGSAYIILCTCALHPFIQFRLVFPYSPCRPPSVTLTNHKRCSLTAVL
ncbi:hypothetical protein F4860DRAFT_480713 [Xylaria cubensis]|nr:hypothetical protein F4860DRAFT_480713 [Xylaria cubensis]